MHWRDRYTYESGREAESLRRLNEEQLVDRIRRKNLDSYFAIWRAIGQKGTVQGSALVLWDFLQSKPGKRNMLHRYHCAAALFKILDMDDPASESEMRRGVQWDSHGEEARQKKLQELRQIIETKLSQANQKAINYSPIFLSMVLKPVRLQSTVRSRIMAQS